ncbi:MAG: phage portal protein, partial [Comamonas sp.]
GEVAPLILLQQAINNVNFDRMIVSRFAAFPQRVITGWLGTESERLRASSMRLWTFAEEDVKATSLPAASVQGYNDVLEEMLQHVAMVAQISPAYVTGKMVNLSAEALAAAEANEQRKLTAKRESFGESWEQVLRLAAEMDGDTETSGDSGAEVVWRDTEARTFAAIVDGVVKLSQAGVPVEQLLDVVPGMTQQKIQAIQKSMRGARVSSLMDRLMAAPTEDNSDAAGNAAVPQPADESVA